jgi:hypothetical protein
LVIEAVTGVLLARFLRFMCTSMLSTCHSN